ncbi:MAG: two-component regulator propeller domain-containing protein [Candidatus Eisenbacteria bacterium]
MRTFTWIALSAALAAALPAAAGDWSTVTVPNDPRVLDLDIEGSVIWMSTHGSGLVGYDGGLWVLHLAAEGGIRSNNYNYTVLVDASGDKWVGRDGTNTVDRLDDAGTHFDKQDDTWTYYTYLVELENSRVFSMAASPQGHVWFGMRDENHNRLGTVELLVDGDGSTTSDDTWYHYDNAWTPDSTSFSDDDVRALALDAAGRLWVGYYASGVDVWDYGDPAIFADDEWAHFTIAEGLANDLVRAIHAGDDGRVWVGTLGGLSVFDPAADTWSTVEGLPGVQVLALDADAHGHVWVATDDGVAMLYANGTVAFTYGTQDGIPYELVSEIAVDRASGTVWAVAVDDITQGTALCTFESGYGSELGDVFVYPNPWKEGAQDMVVTIYGAREGSGVTIMNILGEELRELEPTEPYVWDTLDDDGVEVPSGVYIIRVESPDGSVSLAKAAVVR